MGIKCTELRSCVRQVRELFREIFNGPSSVAARTSARRVRLRRVPPYLELFKPGEGRAVSPGNFRAPWARNPCSLTNWCSPMAAWRSVMLYLNPGGSLRSTRNFRAPYLSKHPDSCRAGSKRGLPRPPQGPGQHSTFCRRQIFLWRRKKNTS